MAICHRESQNNKAEIFKPRFTGAGEYKKYGPWMTNRTSMFVEYKTTDFGIID